MEYRGFTLFPFQEQAIEAIEARRSVVVSAPTGAGKTVIAEYAIERGIEQGAKVVYTSPIKALSNQKYRDFQRRYGDRIGIMTGDVTINPLAPIQIMTTEIFRNTIFESVERVRDVSYVIFDEIHYISDSDRGTVWEESIIFAPEGVRFLGLSATISNLEQFRAWISQVRDQPVDLIHTEDRPVPLSHQLFVPGVGVSTVGGLKNALVEARNRGGARGGRQRDGGRGRPEPRGRRGRSRQPGRGPRAPGPVEILHKEKLLPALYFCFSRRECEARARRATRRALLTPDEQQQLIAEYDTLCDRYEVQDHGGAAQLRKLAVQGVLYHHAGMLPVYKEIVERLFTTGWVKLLFTTETFALGVNMPARTVVFSSLRKYDGVSFDYIPTLDYYQMAGRAGRQGLDDEGSVLSVIDPEFDTVPAVKKVIFGKISPLQSRFNLSYSAILNLYQLLGHDIFSAVDRSFSTFQREGSSKKDRALLKSRLNILESRGYIRDGKLTGKGRFGSRLNSYEIQATELFWAGCFEGLDPEHCAVLIAALVYEPRRGDVNEYIDLRGFGTVRNRARKLIEEFRKTERKFGIEDGIKAPEFSLSAAVMSWARGCGFEDMDSFTSTQDGDLVRNLRMTIQLLRQFAWAAQEDQSLKSRLLAAMELLNRDVVDAERQLRLG